MSDIKFTREEKETLAIKLQDYFEAELNQEIEQFDAEFLVDFIAKEMGAYFYNKGLQDARSILNNRLDTIDDDLYAIEKPIR